MFCCCSCLSDCLLGIRYLADDLCFLSTCTHRPPQLWQALPKPVGKVAPSLCVASYPNNAKWLDAEAEEVFEVLKQTVNHVRSVASELNLINKPLELFLKTANEARQQHVSLLADGITTLTKAKSLSVLQDVQQAPDCLLDARGDVTLCVSIKGMLDPATEISRLQDKQAKLLVEIQSITAEMAAPRWAKKPESVQAARTQKKEKLEQELQVAGRSTVLFQNLLHKA